MLDATLLFVVESDVDIPVCQNPGCNTIVEKTKLSSDWLDGESERKSSLVKAGKHLTSFIILKYTSLY